MILFILACMLLLTGCDVHSVSLKLTDIEYHATQDGWMLRSPNWSHVVLNEAYQIPGNYNPVMPELAAEQNLTGNVSISSNLTGNVSIQGNVTEIDTILVSIENGTIKIR
jgi:hypothetical protein